MTATFARLVALVCGVVLASQATAAATYAADPTFNGGLYRLDDFAAAAPPSDRRWRPLATET
jgi:hypothetical protein